MTTALVSGTFPVATSRLAGRIGSSCAVLGFVLLASTIVPLTAQEPAPAPPPRPPLEALNQSLQRLASDVTPGVVRIFTTGFRAVAGQDPIVTGELATGRAGGSGVLVDSAGYIITNAHVVMGAQAIKVLLISAGEGAGSEGSVIRPRGRLLDAKVVGYDLETDLAVLKIDVRVLRFLKFGDSDTIRKGQLVFAFGNPHGTGDSVSMGVVSSVAYQTEAEDPMIYLRTDALVHPGNDGGPLVNIDGEIVGISNDQVGEGTEEPGFGYAAPVNIVRSVYNQIRRSGRVRRGVIGVRTQTITPWMASALDLPRDQGVIVADVMPGSPADLAGLDIGDIILRADGKEMENARQFDVNIYQRRLDDTVSLDVLRGESEVTIRTPVIERVDDPMRFASMVDPKKNFVPQLGILALDLGEELDDMFLMLRASQGVLVAALPAGSPQVYNFAPGDVIISLNGQPVKSLADLHGQLAKFNKGDIVVLQIERVGLLQYAVVGLE